MSSICSVSCAMVIFGILVSSYYLYQDRIEDSKARKKDKKRLETPEYEGNKELFMLQYEQISEGIRSRDNQTSIAGTILIAASIVLLSSCIGVANFLTRLLIVLASLAIYAIWLVQVNLTAKKMNDLDLSRLRDMEDKTQYKINIHTYRLEKVEHTNWWKYFRRKIWLWLLWVLIVLGIAILSISI